MSIALDRLWRDERGAASAEYALLMAAVAIGCLGAWTALRDRLIEVMEDVTDSLEP